MAGVVWFCFCKQKTAYYMRISHWSADVCSSDLDAHAPPRGGRDGADQIGLARIGDEDVLFERDVEVDDVAVPDDRAGVGHAVANDMVDRAVQTIGEAIFDRKSVV